MISRSTNPLKTLLFFPILIWINSCKNVDNLENSNYFFYNEDQNITSLDPAFVRVQSEMWVASQIFEGLVEYDDQLNIKPALAKSWQISDSGKTYTFQLRTDVYFHSTGIFKGKKRKMKASDVVYSFRRIADPATASPGAWIFNDKMDLRCFTSPDSFDFPVHAPNDSTVVIHLNQAFNPFLGILTMNYCYVVPFEAVNEHFRSQPIGTGPFLFRKWEEDVALLLGRNPDYYRFLNGKRLPYLDGIMVDNIKDKQIAFMKFVQGEYDFFNGIDVSIKDEMLNRDGTLREKYKADFDLIKSPFLNTEYLGFNIDPKFDRHPLNNLHIRKAVDFAINKEKLIRYLRNGVGTPGDKGFVPPGLPTYPYDQLQSNHYNQDSARACIQRSGLDLGKTDPIVINTTKDYLELMVFVQKELQNVGLKTEIRVHPSSFLRQLRKDQQINCFRGSWIADYADPENYLICFDSTNFSPSGPNYFHYKSSRFNALLREASGVTDEKRRMHLMAKAESEMMKAVPCVILFYDESIRLSSRRIHGLQSNPVNFLRLREVSKSTFPES